MATERSKRSKKVEVAEEESKAKPEPGKEEGAKPAAPAHLEERTYTVPLSETRYTPYYKRTSRAIKLIRNFFTRHMKAENVTFTKELNEAMWENGIRNPPRRVKIRATKDDEGNVTLYPAE
nr:50S ribosomal protein L31e [Candidatus Njordarchaeum guaymaensis]